MGRIEEAIIYATSKHNGQVRKIGKTPYIMHPLEVAQIISTMTEDEDVIIAGLLHDVVEDTNTSQDEIRDKFGERVMHLVESETENKYRDRPAEDTWKQRKKESLDVLCASSDRGISILWLADKLANLRSIYRQHERIGDEVWNFFHQKDPKMHEWYFKSVAEAVARELKNEDAFIEYTDKIKKIWDM